jgi:hypothetical protein
MELQTSGAISPGSDEAGRAQFIPDFSAKYPLIRAQKELTTRPPGAMPAERGNSRGAYGVFHAIVAVPFAAQSGSERRSP